jgi:hypothetical protein
MRIALFLGRFVFVFAVSVYAASALRGTTYSTSYQSFNPQTGAFNLTQKIEYVLPNATLFGPGPYPVFFWIPGTYEPYTDPLSTLFLDEMAARGFLAASVEYSNNESVQNCTQYTDRAQGIFDQTRSTSAVGAVCSLSSANCSKGMTASGVSQGAELAILAANYASNMKAIYVLSGGDQFDNVEPLQVTLPCEDKGSTVIPQDRITIVNGIDDPYFGGQSQVEGVTGLTCPTGTYECWSPDGSGAGWYIVQGWQNVTGIAGHCYFTDGINNTYTCNGVEDPNWGPPATYDWSLAPNLDWLATFGTHRNFSSTGY